jgi:hypothetical protein
MFAFWVQAVAGTGGAPQYITTAELVGHSLNGPAVRFGCDRDLV